MRWAAIALCIVVALLFGGLFYWINWLYSPVH
jgi:hypothetical protein